MKTRIFFSLLVAIIAIMAQPASSQVNNFLNKNVTGTAVDTVTEAWVQHYASGLAPAADYSYAIAIDTSGNIYVTGSSKGAGTRNDYATVKYDANGTQQWVARYNGPANLGDSALAIKVDNSGNVYVTGSSKGSGTDYDYATIKYDASGTEQWIARYNGPGNSIDDAFALAVDLSGNVYVTGRSRGSGTNYDYATIMYNSSGVEQWISRYNGPGNSNDVACAIVVDTYGNVYVTGRSSGSGTGNDYATIKYNSYGTELWVARYNGPANLADEANAIAIDASGNIYVTGCSRSSGIDYDYLTIKYNSSGVEQWIARYNGIGNYDDKAKAIAVDASENVFITGTSVGSGTGPDYATIMYNSAGTQQWIARYNLPGNYNDEANSIAVDGYGNVYVTGFSNGACTHSDFATIKYDTSGTVQWINRYNNPKNCNDYANALAVDALGNVYVTGRGLGSETDYDYTTIKYDTSGTEQWITYYNGEKNSYEDASAFTVDSSGNVYVTGRSISVNTYYDYATIKYDSSGVQQWVARYNGPGDDSDEAKAIAVDASGNVYVTGRSNDDVSSSDYATIMYNSAGVQQWVARYNGQDESYDIANAITVDASGNVYVTGCSEDQGPDYYYDYATVKYNSLGVQQWAARYNGPSNFNDVASAIAVDASGNVYVTGWSYLGPYSDYVTIKYNSSGTQQWVARYDGPGNKNDSPYSIAVDVSGNVYVTGYSSGSGTNSDYTTIKYNSSGIEEWIARYNGPGNSQDVARIIVLDNAGNVYVTGRSCGSGGDYDYATIKYNSSGIEEWIARYNGTGNGNDEATSLALDASGNIYVTGKSWDPGTGYDYATIKYNSSGTQQWVVRYNGPENSSEDTKGIVVDPSGNVYVTGTSIGSDWSVYTTVKYVQNPVSVKLEDLLTPQTFSLEQNYPNPFNPATVISFSLPSKSYVSLKVFDVLGRDVSVLISEELHPGVYSREWEAENLPSGVYFYRLQAGLYSETKKFILLR